MKELFAIITIKAQSIWEILIHQGGLIISTIFTCFLSAIGYPKEIILFILALVVIDVLTRWLAEIHIAYGNCSLNNFIKAWKDKVLNSKKLKHGLFLKVIFYTIILFVANKTALIHEIAFGSVISNFLYSLLVCIDLISIFENAVECGFTDAKILVKFFRHKEEQLMGDGDISNSQSQEQTPTTQPTITDEQAKG